MIGLLLILPACIIAYRKGFMDAREHEAERIKFEVDWALWAKEQEELTKLFEEWKFNIERPDIK